MKKNIKRAREKGRKNGQILGINIISTSAAEVLTRVKKNLSHNVHFFIVTPNSELVLMAQKNQALKSALNSSEFPIPDGIGLSYASKYLTGKGIPIIHGRKLMMDLIRLADKNHWKVFLFGGESGEAFVAAEKLSQEYKNLKIVGEQGPKLDKNAEPVTEVDRKYMKDAIDSINKFAPDLLFVAFGNPKQEIWIHKNIDHLRIGGAMCVGGTLRYIAGMSKLPPRWIEKLELEWLWRLITEPKRIARIWNAVVVFSFVIFLSRFSLTSKMVTQRKAKP